MFFEENLALSTTSTTRGPKKVFQVMLVPSSTTCY